MLGLDPIADRAAVRRRTGVLLQRSGFVADLTVAETLQMWAATVTDARPVEESLEMLDLTRPRRHHRCARSPAASSAASTSRAR